MATSVKVKKAKVPTVVVAVRTIPPVDISRSTDFWKADQDKPFDVVEVDGIAIYRVFRKGKVAASYPAPTVISCRLSTRKFRTPKVFHVRVFERVGGSAKKS